MAAERDKLQFNRLERFLGDHDLHLLSDSREGVSVGSLYSKHPADLKSQRIGDVKNFLIPPVELPIVTDKSHQGEFA
jgi:hypothetical protein